MVVESVNFDSFLFFIYFFMLRKIIFFIVVLFIYWRIVTAFLVWALYMTWPVAIPMTIIGYNSLESSLTDSSSSPEYRSLLQEQDSAFVKFKKEFIRRLSQSEAMSHNGSGVALIFWAGFFLLLTLYTRILWNRVRTFLVVIDCGTNSTDYFISNTYIRFLKKYIKEGSIISVCRASRNFFSKIGKRVVFTHQEKLLYGTYFELRSKVKDLHRVLNMLTKNDDCIGLPYEFTHKEGYTCVYINTGGSKVETLKKEILEGRSDILRLFPGYKDGESEFELLVTDIKTHLKLEVFNKGEYWTDRKMNISALSLEAGSLLLGYYPEFDGTWMVHKDYLMESWDMIHTLIRWSSGSGKDTAFRGILTSVIKNIHDFSNFELHALDSKGNDFLFLDGLQSYDIHRYSHPEQYIGVLANLEIEMRRRIEIIWMKENLADYNSSVPKSQRLKEVFVVINELSSLMKRSDDKNLIKALLDKVTILLNEARSSGIHLVIMSQSFKRSGGPQISDLLTNIKDKLILKMDDAWDMAGSGWGLWGTILDKIRTLSDFTALHMEGLTLKQKFKPYFITKEDLESYVNANFKKAFRFENERIGIYYDKVLRTGELNFRESQEAPYLLTRANWDEMIAYLDKEKLIVRNPNKSLTFLREKVQ